MLFQYLSAFYLILGFTQTDEEPTLLEIIH